MGVTLRGRGGQPHPRRCRAGAPHPRAGAHRSRGSAGAGGRPSRGADRRAVRRRSDGRSPGDRRAPGALPGSSSCGAPCFASTLGAPGVSPATRSLGRGVLAVDARERVLRICARSGRPLDATEALAVERVARQAATIPAADPARLETDIADNVRDFMTRHPFPLPAGRGGSADRRGGRARRQRVASTTCASRSRPRTAGACRIRSCAPPPTTWRVGLRPSGGATSRATNFKDMLSGAQLPTEGVLADEVRERDAGGDGAGGRDPGAARQPDGVQARPRARGRRAQRSHAVAALAAGARGPASVAAAGLIAILLVIAGGPAGALSLPLALAPRGGGDRARGAAGRAGGAADDVFLCGARWPPGRILALAVDAVRTGGHGRGPG